MNTLCSLGWWGWPAS